LIEKLLAICNCISRFRSRPSSAKNAPIATNRRTISPHASLGARQDQAATIWNRRCLAMKRPGRPDEDEPAQDASTSSPKDLPSRGSRRYRDPDNRDHLQMQLTISNQPPSHPPRRRHAAQAPLTNHCHLSHHSHHHVDHLQMRVTISNELSFSSSSPQICGSSSSNPQFS
jgi:hypothetical protein